MSKSFVLNRGGMEAEVLFLSSNAEAHGWARLAKMLGLDLLPMFEDFFGIDEANVEQAITELMVLRLELIARAGADPLRIDALGHVIQALEAMWGETGWRASIG